MARSQTNVGGELPKAKPGARGGSRRRPTAIDAHVGRRLRRLRQIHEVSLERLAEMVDVAPQQVQKYEIGETRLSASRIFELSTIFRVPVAWFYEDLEAEVSAETYARIRPLKVDEGDAARATAETARRARLESYYAQLPSEMQERLVDFARMLAELPSRHLR